MFPCNPQGLFAGLTAWALAGCKPGCSQLLQTCLCPHLPSPIIACHSWAWNPLTLFCHQLEKALCSYRGSCGSKGPTCIGSPCQGQPSHATSLQVG